MLLNQDELCVIIAEKYYQPIYKYCYAKLNCDASAAQDCTQNVFLIMIQKKNRLNLSNNMQTWLYKTADRVIRNYRRKEKKYRDEYNEFIIEGIKMIEEALDSSQTLNEHKEQLQETKQIIINNNKL